jgi:amidase
VDVEVLLKKLSSAEWSAVEVTTAYYKRAIVAQQLASAVDHFLYDTKLTHLNQTNCLTEIFVERALLRAAQLDEHLKKTGKVMGPLHGDLL